MSALGVILTILGIAVFLVIVFIFIPGYLYLKKYPKNTVCFVCQYKGNISEWESNNGCPRCGEMATITVGGPK